MTKTYVVHALNKVYKTNIDPHGADVYCKTEPPRAQLTYNEHKRVSDKTDNFGRNHKN